MVQQAGGPITLDEVVAGQLIGGVLPHRPVTVVAATPMGPGSVRVVFEEPDGTIGQVLLGSEDLARLTVVQAAARWTFDAEGADFRLAAEALRMQLAALSDPMLAVTTSDLQPLPHQIRAVYEEMLPRTPLRYLLADDPGAGKTVMAGLLAKEMSLRGDLQRCLVVAPGGLVEQWQEELAGKVGLHFEVLSRPMVDSTLNGSVFDAHPLLIARMDQLSRDDDLMTQLEASTWDLVVVDEAHRMSAHWYGTELSTTRRYKLGQLLGRIARNFLLMTATPHAGKDDDFAAFMALLDGDRFAGRQAADASGLMRRMVKEQLLTFDGKPLFPDRVAETVPYALSTLEQQLYDEVTDYVRTEMNRADALGVDGRTRTVGFALTVLQRRLASSPEAIWRSLQRRHARLITRRDELDSPAARVALLERAHSDLDDDLDDLDAEELEGIEDDVADAATAARTRAELDLEIARLHELEGMAAGVRAAGTDRKWTELSQLLTAHVLVRDGERRKLIVFTEHRDTLTYLQQRIGTLLGDPAAVVSISGGTRREDRRAIRERFSHDPQCSVLVATDAAGEGLNLQAAHLMVNYDLPWNPNRIEQRFGRIHRIGQREVCRLWNLVADGTREGQVFTQLLAKAEQQRKAYGGRLFDVLGTAFAEVPLRTLLLEAIRHGERPEVRVRLEQVVDDQVAAGLRELMAERALHDSVFDPSSLDALRLQMERARARRLQPHFVQRFFCEAFTRLGGRITAREHGRFEITSVPTALQDRVRADRSRTPLAPRYARVAFDPAFLAGPPRAELIAPGHPLMDVVVAETLDRHQDALQRGSVLADLSDPGVVPRLLVALGEDIADGTGRLVSRKFGFVELGATGETRLAGPAPYLDLDPLPPGHDAQVAHTRGGAWLRPGVEDLALAWAAEQSQPAHRAEVAARVTPLVGRTRHEVSQRLNQQVNHWSMQAVRLRAEVEAGRRVKTTPERARQWAEEAESRLDRRLAQLTAEEHLVARPPRVLTAALVLPAGLLTGVRPASTHPVDTTFTERRAVDAVLAAERRLGRLPVEMPHNNPGYDLESTAVDDDGRRQLVFIEVKGRLAGAEDFFVTATEVLHGKNAAPLYRLALVSVDPQDPAHDEVVYVDDPFARTELGDFAATGVRGDWRAMWARGSPPH